MEPQPKGQGDNEAVADGYEWMVASMEPQPKGQGDWHPP